LNGKESPDFNFEITKWQASGNKAIISGKMYGELPEVFFNKVSRIENCVFENVEVEIFNDMLDPFEVLRKNKN
jgi:hypothetical protein